VQTLYLVLCVAGTLIPYAAFLPWLAENGLDPAAFFSEMLSTRIGAFFAFDVIVSAIVLFLFTWIEWRRGKLKRAWLVPLATVSVGVSLGFPLLLYLRERDSAVQRRSTGPAP
jgi:hypothetical protein